MHDIGVAVVGTGFMGWVHVEALRRIGVNNVGICGSSQEKSTTEANRLGLSKAFESFDATLADDDVQVIHIGTPNRTHYEMTKRALAAGKHVMCEKPLAMTSEQSAELVELAKASPLLVTGVNYNIRFYPHCIEARERIRNGSLGRLFHINGSYTQDWLAYSTDYNWRVRAEDGGKLRAIADIGTHWLDLVHAITGLKVLAICADLAIVHPKRERPIGEVKSFANVSGQGEATEEISITTEDYGALLLKFENGVRGTLHVSQVYHGRKNCLRFEVAGSESSIAWNSEEPNQLWVGHRRQPNEIMSRDPSLLSSHASSASDYPGGHNEGYSDSFKQCFRSFYRYIHDGNFGAAREFATFEDGHREIVLCEAILKSHQEQRWVEIENGMKA